MIEIADKEWRKPKTNEQVVYDIMVFSQFGALSQAFVIEALMRCADQVAAMTDEEVEAANANSPINMEAWRGVAREIKRKLDAKYPSNPQPVEGS